MNLYDQHYRKLFSNPAMVRALFHGFLPQRLRHSVDLESLVPLPSSFISSRNRDRRADCIWQVKRRDGSSLYLLILLEHQSRADRFMSIRMLGYSALLYEDIIMRRSEGKRALLPSILPLVLYTGERPWNVPLQVSELLDKAPAGLRIYQPQMRYLLLDEGKLVSQGGLPRDNLVTLLFQLEHNQGLEHIQEIVQTLILLTQGQAHQELSLAFGHWIRHVLLPRSLPDNTALPHVTNLQEVTTMLTTHSRDWSYRWKQEGRLEGRQEGRLEGRQEGRLEGRREGLKEGLFEGSRESASIILNNLLRRKFGALPVNISERINAAETEQLQAWSLNVLDAETLNDVFKS